MQHESPSELGKAAARRAARKRRLALAATERAAMDQAICRHIEQLGAYRRARTVAMFLNFDGEPSITRLLNRASGRSKRFFAPVLDGRTMRFFALERSTVWQKNSFGIREPRTHHSVDARGLDLVLTPLVAFDRTGTRVGMGGGYYDRYFAFLRHRIHWLRPKLVGVAYSFQEVASLRRDEWDVPLWGVVSELGVTICRKG